MRKISKYNRKKEGSVLVIFMIFFTVLLIIGTSITSLAVSTLRVAKVQETIDKNIYTAESGMDIVHEEILRLVQEAYEKGEKAVDNKIENIMNSSTIIESLELEKCFKEEFISQVSSNINNLQEEVNKELLSKTNFAENVRVTLQKKKLNDKYFINASSYYKEKNIEKKVSIDFEILPPEFSKIIMYRNPVWSNALTSDKNIKINSNGMLRIDGNIYAHGENEPPNSEKSKRKGIVVNTEGINTENDNKGNIISINGNLITNENMCIENYADSIGITGKLYAHNLVNEAENTDRDKLAIGFKSPVYLLDDLEINSIGTKMIFDGGVFAVSEGRQAKSHNQSSSILINGEKNEVIINDKLYIAGTSYIPNLYLVNENGIKEAKDYQTGESISIKGNYFVYTDLVGSDEELNQNEYQWYYNDSTLQNGGFNLVKDSSKNIDRFKEYIENQAPYDLFTNENIVVLGKSKEELDVYGLGAIVSVDDSGVKSPYKELGSIEDFQNKIVPKEFELKRNIYSLGNPDMYIADNVKENKPVKIGDLLDINKNILINENGCLIIVNSGNEEIKISNTGVKIGNNRKELFHSKSTNLKCIIISNGDVTVENSENMEIIGTIITNGNINLNNEQSLIIQYDREVVENLVGQYYTELNSIFKTNSSFTKEIMTWRDMSINRAFEAKDFVKRKNWSVK